MRLVFLKDASVQARLKQELAASHLWCVAHSIISLLKPGYLGLFRTKRLGCNEQQWTPLWVTCSYSQTSEVSAQPFLRLILYTWTRKKEGDPALASVATIPSNTNFLWEVWHHVSALGEEWVADDGTAVCRHEHHESQQGRGLPSPPWADGASSECSQMPLAAKGALSPAAAGATLAALLAPKQGWWDWPPPGHHSVQWPPRLCGKATLCLINGNKPPEVLALSLPKAIYSEMSALLEGR